MNITNLILKSMAAGGALALALFAFRKWARYILLPLVPDLLVSLPLVGLLWTDTLDVMLLYMPDVSRIALVCGGFALVWMFVRTGLVFRTLRKPLLA